MAGFSSILLGVGTAVSAFGTAASIKAQGQAADKQAKQQKLAYRRGRFQKIREAQLLRAQTVASATGSNTMDSSGAKGGLGSLSSQLGSELAFGAQMSSLSKGIDDAQRRAANWGAFAQIGAGAASLGSNSGGSYTSIFNSFKPKTTVGNS